MIQRRDEKFGLALRVPRYARIPGLGDRSVVDLHNSHRGSYGTVGFGKFGAGLSNPMQKRIEEVSENGADVNLYVVSKSTNDFICWRAKISSVVSDVIKVDWRKIVPEYYAERPSTVFMLAEKLKKFPVQELVLESNNRSLLDVLRETRTPIMCVKGAEGGEGK